VCGKALRLEDEARG
jgi:hypothetical protein